MTLRQFCEDNLNEMRRDEVRLMRVYLSNREGFILCCHRIDDIPVMGIKYDRFIEALNDEQLNATVFLTRAEYNEYWHR